MDQYYQGRLFRSLRQSQLPSDGDGLSSLVAGQKLLIRKGQRFDWNIFSPCGEGLVGRALALRARKAFGPSTKLTTSQGTFSSVPPRSLLYQMYTTKSLLCEAEASPACPIWIKRVGFVMSVVCRRTLGIGHFRTRSALPKSGHARR
jgi:hypothetical protein